MSSMAWLTIGGWLILCGQLSAQQYIGRAHCAAATCHGGIRGSGPAWSSSLRAWEWDDQKHAQAGSVLFGELSQRIVQRLQGAKFTELAAESDYLRLLQERCVSCHAPRAVATEHLPVNRGTLAGVIAAGVDCEACHGPASGWLEQHTQLEWLSQPETSHTAGTLARKLAAGMIPMESWTDRARQCMQCHIGARDEAWQVRDVNHDLLAAGHPPLRFNMSYFQSRLPVHWEPSDQAGTAWVRQLNGQSLVTEVPSVAQHDQGIALGMQHSIRLAEGRLRQAQDPGGDMPFPELSEFSCTACHHALQFEKRDSSWVGGLPAWGNGPARVGSDMLYLDAHLSRQSYASFLERLALRRPEDLGWNKRLPALNDSWDNWAAWYWEQRIQQLNQSPADEQIAALLNELNDLLQLDRKLCYDPANPARLPFDFEPGQRNLLRALVTQLEKLPEFQKVADRP